MAEVKVNMTDEPELPEVRSGDVWSFDGEMPGEVYIVGLIDRTENYVLLCLNDGDHWMEPGSIAEIARQLQDANATLIGRSEDLVIEISVREKGC